MEYVEGTDLSKLVREYGPLPVPHACNYILQAALGLQHAHEKGMVHRDIKPSNLLVSWGSSRNVQTAPVGTAATGRPVVKILDMGLARLIDAEDGVTSELTQEGAVMGTVDYLAPEQALDSRKADIRSDLYSLGCTFYFMLTGKVPFPGGTATEKLLKHRLDEPTPVEQLRPEVSPGLAGVVRKLMAKKPGERYQTPAEVVRALDARTVGGGLTAGRCRLFRRHSETTFGTLPEAVPVGPRRCSWLLLAGLLVGAAFFGFAVVGIAFLAFGSRKAVFQGQGRQRYRRGLPGTGRPRRRPQVGRGCRPPRCDSLSAGASRLAPGFGSRQAADAACLAAGRIKARQHLLRLSGP